VLTQVVLIASVLVSGGTAGAQTPSVTVPGSGSLDDGQRVVISMSGFEPQTRIGISQCSSTVLNSQAVETDCEILGATLATTNSSGSATTTLVVHRFLSGVSGLDCATAGNCVIGAAQFTSAGTVGTFATTPTTFSGGSAPPPPSQSVNLTVTGRSHWKLVGTVTCAQSATVSLYGLLQPPASTPPSNDPLNPLPRASGTRIVNCGTDPTNFAVLLTNRTGRFKAGVVRTLVTASVVGGSETDTVRADVSWGQEKELPNRLAGPSTIGVTAGTVRLVTRNGLVKAQVTINCPQGAPQALAVTVRQLYAKTSLKATGTFATSGCSGSMVAEVPLVAKGGVLVSGAATAVVSTDHNATVEPIAIAPATVNRRMRPSSMTPMEVPGSKAAINGAVRRSLRASFTCSARGAVVVDAQVAYIRARHVNIVTETSNLSGGNGYSFTCGPGTTAVSIPLSGRINAKNAVAKLTASSAQSTVLANGAQVQQQAWVRL
jgi:hypothetical protein